MSDKWMVSHDGTKQFKAEGPYDCCVYIKSSETGEILKKREDSGGYHYELAFSQDDQKVMYFTQCKHCYCNPSLTVWDFEKRKAWSLSSEHHRASYITAEAHNDDLSIVVLACNYGEVSLIRPYEKQRVWHREPIIPDKLRILSLRIDGDKGLVWVNHEKGVDVLSLEDGSTRTHQLLQS